MLRIIKLIAVLALLALGFSMTPVAKADTIIKEITYTTDGGGVVNNDSIFFSGTGADTLVGKTIFALRNDDKFAGVAWRGKNEYGDLAESTIRFKVLGVGDSAGFFIIADAYEGATSPTYVATVCTLAHVPMGAFAAGTWFRRTYTPLQWATLNASSFIRPRIIGLGGSGVVNDSVLVSEFKLKILSDH